MAVVEETPPDFSEFGLYDRITSAIAKLRWAAPTLIQASAIPHILEGKDVLARARTGSGKTGAFAIPVIQKVIETKKFMKKQATRAVILAPSKELCSQLYSDFKSLTRDCSRDVSVVDLSQKTDTDDKAPLLLEKPDIVIGTPARIVTQASAEKGLDLRHLSILIVDEADLIFSFGFDEDMKEFRRLAPSSGFQVVLMSATLTPEVLELKKLTLHSPVILKLQEPQLPPILQLTQYHILVEEEEKFLLIYALFKLSLIKGKTIIFVRNVDRCYKVKLYLEQFGISSCIVNAELPSKSRCHIVAQFNAGLYDIVIASDEANLEEGGAPVQTAKSDKNSKKIKQKSARVTDKESGISRGLDFQFVSNVINLDFPPDADSYIHRVGRTARGKNTGTALSFVDHKELSAFHEVQAYLKEMYGENDEVTKPFKFKMDEVDPLRYRSRDAYKSVTKIAIREARLKEIRQEILSSENLKSHFESNPADLAVLRHDKALHTIKIQPHLKDMPDYIIPSSLKGQEFNQKQWKKKKMLLVKPPEGNFDPNKLKKKKDHPAKLKRLRNAKDPLKSFKFEGFKKAKKT